MKTGIIKLYERALRDVRDRMFGPFFYHGELPFESVMCDVMKTTWRMVLYHPRKGPFPLATEKAVLALIRRGVNRDRIRFYDGSFHVQLEHVLCEIHRYGYRHSCIARCFGDQFDTHFAMVRVGPEEFAGLLLEFDASIPEMTGRTRVFYEEFLEMERRKQQEEMIRRIRLTTIRATR